MVKIQVIGVVGCTGTGKTTLCERIEDASGAVLVSGDSFFLPPDLAPSLDLRELWEDGDMPIAFEKKTADTNVPQSIDWQGFDHAVETAIESCSVAGKGLVLVESFLLCSSHTILERLDKVLFLDHRSISPEILIRRKWERSHLGKSSYKDRGVSLEDYTRYWNEYVLKRYETYSCLCRLPPETVVLDCTLPEEELTRRALAALCDQESA